MPTIAGDYTCCDLDPILFSHPARFGGLSIAIVHEIAFFDLKNSRKLTSSFSELIKEL